MSQGNETNYGVNEEDVAEEYDDEEIYDAGDEWPEKWWTEEEEEWERKKEEFYNLCDDLWYEMISMHREQMEECVLPYCRAIYDHDQSKENETYEKLHFLILSIQSDYKMDLLNHFDGNEQYAVRLLAFQYYDMFNYKSVRVLRSKSFKTVYEADRWMLNHPTIIVKDSYVQVQTSYGLFANHSKVVSVTIDFWDYKQRVKYIYGLHEEERTSFFVESNLAQIKRSIMKRNPKWEVLKVDVEVWARGSQWSLFSGAGTNRAENVKLFILYRVQTNGESR